ncbi:Retrovirus-related Pol polyprotein from transposon 297, partial [Araneus ventricosus]
VRYQRAELLLPVNCCYLHW